MESQPPSTGQLPVWVGAQRDGAVPVLAWTGAALVSAWLHPADLEAVLAEGPALLESAGGTTIPAGDVERVRTGDAADLLVERRGDVNVTVTFANPEARDAALSGLHRVLAPGAPLERLRRPLRQFAEAAGLAALVLAVGLTLPWMVETGQIDRTHWLAASVYNTLGGDGFRAVGVAAAAACLAWLAFIAVRNPVRAGFRVPASPRRRG